MSVSDRIPHSSATDPATYLNRVVGENEKLKLIMIDGSLLLISASQAQVVGNTILCGSMSTAGYDTRSVRMLHSVHTAYCLGKAQWEGCSLGNFLECWFSRLEEHYNNESLRI